MCFWGVSLAWGRKESKDEGDRKSEGERVRNVETKTKREIERKK